MSDIGRRVREEVEERLGNILADEEIKGMIDAAIPRVREQLTKQVEKNVSEIAKRQLEPFFETWRKGEEFEAIGNQIAAAMVERIVGAYEEDAKALAVGQRPPHANRNYYDSQIYQVVQQGFIRRLVEAVDSKIESLELGVELKEKADQIVAQILPRAAASYLESGAYAMVRSFIGAVREGKDVTVSLSKGHGGSCPGCHRQLKSCPKCNHFVLDGEKCCGEFVY